jgi:hypothetical protein
MHRQGGTAAAKRTKAAFLEAFGHDHGRDRWDIRKLGPFDAEIGEPIEDRLAAAELTYGVRPFCGWWFCDADEDSVPWSELEKAHARLDGIDSHGPKVAKLARAYVNVHYWGGARNSYEELERELLRPVLPKKVPSPSPGRAEALRSEYLVEAEALRKRYLGEIRGRAIHAVAAKPVWDGNNRRELQAAIRIGRSYGWKASAIAAALVLTGAEKVGPKDPSRRRSGFAAVVHAVEAAAKRLK